MYIGTNNILNARMNMFARLYPHLSVVVSTNTAAMKNFFAYILWPFTAIYYNYTLYLYLFLICEH